MTLMRALLTTGLAAVISLGTSALAFAHGPDANCANQACGWHIGPMMGQQGQMPMMGGGMMGQGMGPGMMGQGQMGQGQMPMMGQGMGPGMMGPGMMGHGQMGEGQMPTMGQGMGPGMMGQGQMPMMGQGMMGRGMMGQGQMMASGDAPGPGMMQPLRQDLSAADVQHMMEHRLAWQGNPNVKVGKVEETDDDTIVAEIVTQDGSLVQKLEVDRHTGWMRPAQ